jgi:hypothetical protein
MRYEPSEATEDWKLLEVVQNEEHLCSDEYADANNKDLGNIFSELRLLRAAGCPPNRLRGNPEVDPIKWKCTGSHKKTPFFVLKAKPSGWRLYFRILNREKKQLEFLYAVNKKKNERNDKDLEHCCKILEHIAAGETRNERLYIPPR